MLINIWTFTPLIVKVLVIGIWIPLKLVRFSIRFKLFFKKCFWTGPINTDNFDADCSLVQRRKTYYFQDGNNWTQSQVLKRPSKYPETSRSRSIQTVIQTDRLLSGFYLRHMNSWANNIIRLHSIMLSVSVFLLKLYLSSIHCTFYSYAWESSKERVQVIVRHLALAQCWLRTWSPCFPSCEHSSTCRIHHDVFLHR